MTTYCPESKDANERVWGMVNLTLRCGLCGQAYQECENVGSWKCPALRVWDFSRDRDFPVQSDHGGPYTDASVNVYPSYEFKWVKGTRPEAIVARDRARQPGTIAIYETVWVSRVNQAQYAETQHKIHVPPPHVRVIDGYGLQR